jgi:hypothetical protein
MLFFSMRTLFLSGFALGLATSVSLADEAFFSADGKSVTFVPRTGEGYLLRLDIDLAKVSKLRLGPAVMNDTVTALCRGGDGETLLTTANGVYVHDAKGTRKLTATPVQDDWPIEDLAAAPASMTAVGDWLFLSGTDANDKSRRTLYARNPGAKGFEPVFCRRVERVGASVFTPSGRFFFGGDGDLWEGSFEVTRDGDAMSTVLVGARVAPLGVFNTDMSNSGSMWVEQVMVAGRALYVRLHGRLISELVRVPIHPTPALDEKAGAMSGTTPNYRYQSEVMSKVEVITIPEDDIRISAAISIEGSERLFYRASDGEGNLGLYIWEYNTGKSRKVAVEKSEE